MRRVGRAGAGGAKRPHRPRPEAARGAAARIGKGQAAAPAAKPQPTRRETKAQTQEVLATGVQTLVVEPDEAEMRVDRFLVARFPQLAFTHIQRIVRKGELRIDGKRAQAERAARSRPESPHPAAQARPAAAASRATRAKDQDDRDFLKSITLYEDKDVLIINKPMGLAVQGGSGTKRHVDGLLEALTRRRTGQKPRLVHRLDKDTAGCLVIAKTRFAASTMAKSFRSRATRKIYWALVAGVPRVRQGRVSTYLAKEEATRAIPACASPSTATRARATR